jgi:hypothetical protein
MLTGNDFAGGGSECFHISSSFAVGYSHLFAMGGIRIAHFWLLWSNIAGGNERQLCEIKDGLTRPEGQLTTKPPLDIKQAYLFIRANAWPFHGGNQGGYQLSKTLSLWAVPWWRNAPEIAPKCRKGSERSKA